MCFDLALVWSSVILYVSFFWGPPQQSLVGTETHEIIKLSFLDAAVIFSRWFLDFLNWNAGNCFGWFAAMV